MATSCKASLGALLATAVVMVVALLAGPCTAQLPPLLPPTPPLLPPLSPPELLAIFDIVNQLNASITYTMNVTAPLPFNASVVIPPGETQQVSFDLGTLGGAVSGTQTITVENTTYSLPTTALEQVLGAVGVATLTVSSVTCSDNQPGLLVTVSSTLPVLTYTSSYCIRSPSTP